MSEHCPWCKKDVEPVPMVSSIKVPMICPKCGGHYWNWGHRKLQQVLKKLRRRKSK